MDVKTAQDGVDPAQNDAAFRGRHIPDQDVTAEGVGAGSKAPDMQIVDIDDAVDLAHGADDVLEAHAPGKALEQNIERLTGDVPCGPQDEHADKDGQQRINAAPRGEIDYDAAGDQCDGAERVAEHVDVGGADIQIVRTIA